MKLKESEKQSAKAKRNMKMYHTATVWESLAFRMNSEDSSVSTTKDTTIKFYLALTPIFENVNIVNKYFFIK